MTAFFSFGCKTTPSHALFSCITYRNDSRLIPNSIIVSTICFSFFFQWTLHMGSTKAAWAADPLAIFSFTTYREVKTLLKQKQKSAWRLRNNGYDPQKDQINTLDRRTQTTIFRLRTGHCGLRKHLKRLGLADSAHCECGSEEQTPEHILQTCPHLETVRQQFWPEDTEVGTKLWGQAAELQRTADFLAATGLRT